MYAKVVDLQRLAHNETLYFFPQKHCPSRLELNPPNAVIVKVQSLNKELTDPPQGRITRKWPYTAITAGSGHRRNGCKPERSFLSPQPSEYFTARKGYSEKQTQGFYYAARRGYKCFSRTVTVKASLDICQSAGLLKNE